MMWRSEAALAELTLQLCAIPSVTGEEAACAAFVEARLQAAGLMTERVGLTILAQGPRRGRPLVVLAGHTDTVPLKASDGEILGNPPRFSVAPTMENGRIRGLGASDMKGGLAVMLALAEDLPLETLPYDLGFVFYDREEGPWAESGLGPALEACPWLKEAALVFCLEPSDNVIQVGCVGSMHATVIFEGKAAHSARPWQGMNAIHLAGPLLSRLATLSPKEYLVGGFLFREVLSATLAKGGVGRNVVPDRFELNLNYRFAPGKSLDEAEAELRALIGEGATIRLTDRSPSGRVVTENPLLQKFIALNQVQVTAKQAWTDVARFSVAGIDAVNLGPGNSAQAHQAGEWADIPLLAESYQQFCRFLGHAPEL